MAQSFEGANLNGADLEEADLRGADLRNVDLSTVRSFYKASLAAEILSEIRAKWPEKLATIRDDAKGIWTIDEAVLKQIKNPNWQGWPKEEDQAKQKK